MTLEKLLECSAEQLEAMTDAQLMEHFEPYLDITRIERQTIEKVQKNMGKIKRAPSQTTKDMETKNKARHIAQQLGLDMSFLDET